jgi:hypothetical protein
LLLLVLVLQWDATGETLAVLPAGCSFVYTWTAATKELQKLDTDFKASKAYMLAVDSAAADEHSDKQQHAVIIHQDYHLKCPDRSQATLTPRSSIATRRVCCMVSLNNVVHPCVA